MDYNFYAGEIDKKELLEFIFVETDLRLFDLGSTYGEEICEYKSVSEIVNKFDLKKGGTFATTFQMWSHRHEGEPLFRRVKLDPSRCKGHTFRYSTDGWGMIQLCFGGIKNKKLYQSHIGHFNEKDALKNQSMNHFNGKVEQWNWEEIIKTSRKLKYQIHNKMAVDRIGSIGVLKEASGMRDKHFRLY